jgi:hypothetical protein
VVTTVAEFFTVDTGRLLRNELVNLIIARHTSTPRHLQIELGPSELGHPCPRRMAYALSNDPVPRCNPQWDPLPSIIGTATHTWLADAAVLANTELGRDRWLVEQKVYPADWLPGHADLFDTDTGTVIDWKVPGANQFGILKTKMNPVYRAQAHLYGKGFVRAGHTVNTVAIMLLPRGGTLSGAHLWSEPYNEKIADAAMGRRNQILAQLKVFEIHEHPERYEWFAKDGYQCLFCPWFATRPDGPLQCGGDSIMVPTP